MINMEILDTGTGNKNILTELNHFKIIPSNHDDYIHDISFDHYGRRVATCSGDRTVCIWDLDDDNDFRLSNQMSGPESSNSCDATKWKAHSGSVNGVSWAHPEYGQLLATCGSDGLAIVWEELTDGAKFHKQSNKIWANRARLVDSRRSLSTVKFSPRYFRLQLATGSADGTVRIYEAVDVSNLSQWMLMHSIRVEEDDQNVQGLFLGVSCLDWSTGRFEAPALVVGGCSGNVTIYRYSDLSQCWGAYMKLEGHFSSRPGVLDVAWSPNVGRSYHLISSCGRDRVLRLHRLKRIRGPVNPEYTENVPISTSNLSNHKDTNISVEGSNGSCHDSLGKHEITIAKGMAGLHLESTQILDTDDREVWRCAWNITGTVLASSGEDGSVQLWKSDFHCVWKCVSEIHGNFK